MKAHASSSRLSGAVCLGRARNRSAGTTLLEVLVVIVIFLVGILAVVQIFPKGFQILITTRNNSVASSLASDEIARLQADPDRIPEMIVPTPRWLGGVLTVDTNFNPSTLNTLGDTMAQSGVVGNGALALGPWQLYSGANTMRRIIGEGGRIPAPRQTGSSSGWYGSLVVLQFGPIQYIPASGANPSNLTVYGNDLDGHMQAAGPADQWGDGEFFVANADNNAIAVQLPSGPEIRRYHVSFSAYVQSGATYIKRDYTNLTPIDVPVGVPVNGVYPLFTQSLAAMIPDTLSNVDTNTLRVQRQYYDIGTAGTFSSDPYEYKLVDTAVGELLFNPIAASVYFDRPDRREPLIAKVNYDVYDWRVLRDDFRLLSASNVQQHKLPIGSLKVANEPGPDGIGNGDIPILEDAQPAPYSDDSAANFAGVDNVVVVDLTTGGIVMEAAPSSTTQLIHVNKLNGNITFLDADGDPTNGTTAWVLLPDKTTTEVQLEDRALRVFYRTKNEFSVQVLKAASQYTLSPTQVLSTPGQFYIGGSIAGVGLRTRIYFPVMDVGRKVTADEIDYKVIGKTHQLLGQDFVIQFNPGDTLNLPSIDVRDIDSGATSFDYTGGSPVRDVRGASVEVRVLWNPTRFSLVANSAQNLNRLNTWGQSWRKTTNETFLAKQEVTQ